MTVLRLPALRSDDTLGYLAALGTVELCTTFLGWPVGLGWEGLGGCALLDAPVGTVDELAQALAGVADGLRSSGRIVPATDPDLIPAPLGARERAGLAERGALDPLKMPADLAIRRFDVLQERELAGEGKHDARWICAAVDQVAPARSGDGDDRRLAPLYAPSGQMTLNQLYRDSLAEVLRSPVRLHEALVAWSRTKGTGGNLDVRALVDGAQSSAGEPDNKAVWGATWLALQAMPFFTQVGDGRTADALGWERVRGSGSTLRWPVWTPALDRAAIVVLLGHPAIRGTQFDPKQLEALGVVEVLRSRRKGLSKSAGALQLPQELWPVARDRG